MRAVAVRGYLNFAFRFSDLMRGHRSARARVAGCGCVPAPTMHMHAMRVQSPVARRVAVRQCGGGSRSDVSLCPALNARRRACSLRLASRVGLRRALSRHGSPVLRRPRVRKLRTDPRRHGRAETRGRAGCRTAHRPRPRHRALGHRHRRRRRHGHGDRDARHHIHPSQPSHPSQQPAATRAAPAPAGSRQAVTTRRPRRRRRPRGGPRTDGRGTCGALDGVAPRVSARAESHSSQYIHATPATVRYWGSGVGVHTVQPAVRRVCTLESRLHVSSD